MKFYIVVNVGGRTKRVKDSARQIAHARGLVYGLTEYYGPKGSKGTDGCKVFIYSRQSKRELADTFFHEMTHVFLHTIAGIKVQGRGEESLARWMGYMAKLLFADYDPAYTRSLKKRRVYG